MRQRKQIQAMTYLSLFLAIEIILCLTPLGFIRTPILNITLMHIPVILSGIILGPKYGAMIGLVFGIASVYNSTVAPNASAFVFSPFVSVGGVGGNWTSLITAIVPRVLTGASAGWIFLGLKKKVSGVKSASIAGLFATLLHTVMVLGFIYLFWGVQYAAALGQTYQALLGLFATTICTNGLLEAALASIVSGAVYKVIQVRTPEIQRGF